jgi:type I restriction enzyme, S subunit
MNIEAVKSALISLAIRGKLAPQRDDEPAVEQIGEAPEEAPFEIPAKWKWVALNQLGTLITGTTPKTSEKKFFGDDVPFVKPNDFLSSGCLSLRSNGLSVDGAKIARMIPAKSVLMVCIGGSIGKCAVTSCQIAINQQINAVIPNSCCNYKYLFFCLLSKFFQKSVNASTTGTAIPIINKKRWGRLFVPLPPLAEQRRIVAKLEELLEPLSRVQERLGNLTHDFPEQFKAAVLQKAIQGKLVPQRDDEPAVEQIGEAPEEAPFEIPAKWKWCKLGEIADYGSTSQIMGTAVQSKDWLLDLEDIEKNTGRLIRKKRGASSKSNKNSFHAGNVLWGKLRPYLNKVLIADEDGFCTTEIVPISTRNDQYICKKYLKTCLMSPYFVDRATNLSYGVKMPRMGTKDATNSPIPLPPLAEQRRIVAKVEQLFSQVDELTARLSS